MTVTDAETDIYTAFTEYLRNDSFVNHLCITDKGITFSVEEDSSNTLHRIREAAHNFCAQTGARYSSEGAFYHNGWEEDFEISLPEAA